MFFHPELEPKTVEITPPLRKDEFTKKMHCHDVPQSWQCIFQFKSLNTPACEALQVVDYPNKPSFNFPCQSNKPAIATSSITPFSFDASINAPKFVRL